MIFNIKGKVIKKDDNIFLNILFFNLKVNYIIGDYELDFEKEYFIFINAKLDNKNKMNFDILLSNNYDNLSYFSFLISIDLFGIKTTQKIFNIGIEEFKKSVEEQNIFILKSKYKLSDKQIENIFKKVKPKNNDIAIKEDLQAIEQQLTLLGYKKNVVNKILINKYQDLNLLSIDEIIKFMIKELSYYESQKK